MKLKQHLIKLLVNSIIPTLYFLANYLAPTDPAFEFLSVCFWEYIDFVYYCVQFEYNLGKWWWLR